MKQPLIENDGVLTLLGIMNLISTIEHSTQPKDGHGDPRSIHDCFMELRDQIELYSNKHAKAYAKEQNERLISMLKKMVIVAKNCDWHKSITGRQIILNEAEQLLKTIEQ